jgi:hypothetical protein
VKQLLILTKNVPTVQQAMTHIFTSENQTKRQIVIQKPDSRLIRFPGDSSRQFDLGYQQIWLYTMQHCLPILLERQKSDDQLANPTMEKDRTMLHEMAVLTHKLGFQFNQISQLIAEYPD